jgi:hypothetical protein
MALIDKLTAIADAIRAKTGKTDSLTLDQMPTEIGNISGGGSSGGSSGGNTVKASVSVGVPDIGNTIAVDVPISVNVTITAEDV